MALSHPSGPPLDSVAIAADLERLRCACAREAGRLAQAPGAWQAIAHALGTQRLAWYRPPLATDPVWRPGFRAGSTRQSAAEALATLGTGGSEGAFAEAVEFLTVHFSGEALARLREQQQAPAATVEGQIPRDWWPMLPGETASAESVRAFAHDRAEVDESRRAALGVVRELGPILLGHLQNFYHAEAPAGPRASSSERSSQVGQYFSLSGQLYITPGLREPLRARLDELAATLVTSVEWNEQLSAAAVRRHVEKRIEGELLHEAHAMLGKLQETLIGSLVLAGFPLYYWHELARGAKPGPELPQGRRQEFTETEAAAIYQALWREARATVEAIAAPADDAGSDQREGLLTLARQRAGRLGFEHISAWKLFLWVDACEALVDRPEITGWSWGRSVVEMKEDCRCFREVADQLRSLFHLIIAKNNGLAGTIHAGFVRKNQTFQGTHDARDVASLVREEMLKATASFDYATGVRFSTYAVNRINFEMRRRPHQERQLIKLSSDQTTAQPRVWQLAVASELAESDPAFYRDLAERYNQTFRGTGRSAMTASQAADLLRVGHSATLGPADPEDGERHPAIEIPAAAPETSPEILAEISECVRAILRSFAPGEEFALSVLLRVSPPAGALQRFNTGLREEAMERLARVIGSNSSPAQQGSPLGFSGRRVRLTPGHLSEKLMPDKSKTPVSPGKRAATPGEPVRSS